MSAIDDLGPGGVDAELGVLPLFISIARADLILLKLLVESYEGIGVIRTQDPSFAPGRALIVVMLVPDSIAAGRRLLAEFGETTPLEMLPTTPELVDQLKRDLLG